MVIDYEIFTKSHFYIKMVSFISFVTSFLKVLEIPPYLNSKHTIFFICSIFDHSFYIHPLLSFYYWWYWLLRFDFFFMSGRLIMYVFQYVRNHDEIEEKGKIGKNISCQCRESWVIQLCLNENIGTISMSQVIMDIVFLWAERHNMHVTNGKGEKIA